MSFAAEETIGVATAASVFPVSRLMELSATSPTSFDAIVIGGGPAGLSAALALGRSRRRVLVAADGPTRNAPADAAHNVFTRDGAAPADLVQIGREQLTPYDVTVREEWATDAECTEDGFRVTFASGDVLSARGIVLATGVRDVLPDLPGFSKLWGTGVFHCPYCHGWEVAGRPLALYGKGETALHLPRSSGGGVTTSSCSPMGRPGWRTTSVRGSSEMESLSGRSLSSASPGCEANSKRSCSKGASVYPARVCSWPRSKNFGRTFLTDSVAHSQAKGGSKLTP